MPKQNFLVTGINNPKNSPRRIIQLTSVTNDESKAPTTMNLNIEVATDYKAFPLEMDKIYEFNFTEVKK